MPLPKRFAPLIALSLLAACTQPVKHSPEPIPAQAPVPTLSPAPAAPAPVVADAPAGVAPSAEQIDAFVAEAEQASGMPAAEIRGWLAQARFQQSIINAISRPAEGKPWKDYRPIFLTDTRIGQGRTFYAEHRSEVDGVAARTGVPAEIIIAIIGVETSYGRITGSYRVLDALYTLAFYYPKREEFFRSELVHVFALAREEKLDLATLKGSYAGAMGWGQFMPSSYRNYARDGDGDGRRDLLTSTSDAFASIANYFIGYGWRRGEPVMVRASVDAGVAPFVPDNYEAKFTLAELGTRGYRPAEAGAPDLPVSLITLEGANGPESWIIYKNFWVITRYNRSPLYATAVYQLSREIAVPPEAANAAESGQ
jgi:membrane-bound lytic murein transglycosylase B